MKTRYSILIFVCAVTIGGFFVWLFSPTYSSVEIIHATKVENEFAAGSSIYDVLSKKLYGQKVIVLGIAPHPEQYQEFIKGFISRLHSQNQKLVLLKESKWPNLDLPKDIQVANFDFDTDDFGNSISEIKSAADAGQTIVIYSASIFTTHLMPKNALARFEKAYGESLPSVTFGPLVLRSLDENLNEPACVGAMKDSDDMYRLGCAQVFNSRNQYEKFITLKQETMIMTEEAPGDYIVQIYFPTKTSLN